MAKTLAHMPSVQKAFETDDPSRTLQPIAENARKQSGAQYIVIGSADAIRYAHPDPGKIGKPMVGGDNRRALEKGEAYVSEAVGTLGPAIRGKAPIHNENGEIVGIISVGFLIENIQDIVYQYQSKFIFLLGFVVLMGILGAVYISRNVKKSIFGLEPYEINQLYTEKQAITESVHEALIAINKHEEITLLNRKACELLRVESRQTDFRASSGYAAPRSAENENGAKRSGINDRKRRINRQQSADFRKRKNPRRRCELQEKDGY
ncbi:hypothetical protein [Bacillus licheniformis]|uniref:hypothetical protein n=1 Tax=Bacillus licheniformis TaxID=1402 RepID=UPI001F2759D6|nr:hypothetical protein [Bacillus licheniformis]